MAYLLHFELQSHLYSKQATSTGNKGLDVFTTVLMKTNKQNSLRELAFITSNIYLNK